MNPLKKIKSLFVLLLLPSIGLCHNEVAINNSGYFSNTLFLTLLVIIILLAFLIVAFAGAFKNVADSDYLINKFRKEDDKKSDVTKIVTVIIMMLSSLTMMSQEDVIAVVKDDGRIGGLDPFTFFFMLIIIVLEVLIFGLLLFQFNYLIKKAKAVSEIKKKESKLLQSLTGAVDIENEQSILLDHDYDGIKELDNDLPPWWKYGFYLTVVVSVVYMLHFHVLGTGDLQLKEYENDIAKAKIAVDEYMKKSANNVDENTIKFLSEPTDITTGKDLFISSCAACHGKTGEGSVGPNLTDEYWLHGGNIQDIFKSVKYGWVEKGMKSWKEDLSPMQIAQITSFIKTLKGTNPANPKEAQGEIYTENIIALNDTTLIKTDSLTLKPDSLSTTKK